MKEVIILIAEMALILFLAILEWFMKKFFNSEFRITIEGMD